MMVAHATLTRRAPIVKTHPHAMSAKIFMITMKL